MWNSSLRPQFPRRAARRKIAASRSRKPCRHKRARISKRCDGAHIVAVIRSETIVDCRMPDFLLEIGCEEIPARMIDSASQELQKRLAASGTVSYLDTPRRLAVMASGIPVAQSDLTEEVTGPPVSVAFKDGKPA